MKTRKPEKKTIQRKKSELPPIQEDMIALDPRWVDIKDGPLVAGAINREKIPPQFHQEMLSDLSWAQETPPDTRRAIAFAIGRQCVPWFVCFEGFRDHMKEFCARHSDWSVKRAKYDEGRFEYLLEEVDRMGESLESVIPVVRRQTEDIAKLSERVASLEQELKDARLPPHLKDSATLPIWQRLHRAQGRARSSSPSASRLHTALELAAELPAPRRATPYQ